MGYKAGNCIFISRRSWRHFAFICVLLNRLSLSTWTVKRVPVTSSLLSHPLMIFYASIHTQTRASFICFAHILRIMSESVQQVLKYLNVHIIQTDQGTSIDQTHHIKTSIIDKWFPVGKAEQLKTVDTPYCTDLQFEKDLSVSEQLPATRQELKLLEKQYGG